MKLQGRSSSHTCCIRALVRLLVLLVLVVAMSAAVAADCGFCSLQKYWGGVTNGSYRFDGNVPSHVQQAAYAADNAGWGAHFYHPSGEMLITISPDLYYPVTGDYNANDNIVRIAEWFADSCVSACNPLISTINHEWGHSLGYEHFEEGCTGSVMAWERDRNSVFEPSSSDMCSQMAWSEYCEPGADPRTCTPYLPALGPRDTARIVLPICAMPAGRVGNPQE